MRSGTHGFLAGLLATIVLAGAAGSAKGPLLRLSERVVDFGRVEQHQQVKKDVVIRNEGDTELRILKVSADCGCTAAVPSDSMVPPGGSVKIQVSFSTREYKGIQEKKVVLQTNDPAEPKAVISVRADVHALVRVSEERIRFPKVRRGEEATQRVRFAADKGLGLQLDGVSGGEDYFTTSVEPDPSSSEDAFWLVLKLKPDVPAGSFRKSVHVRTKGPRVVNTRLFVSGSVTSYFEIEGEAKLVIPPTRAGQAREAALSITCDGSKSYRLLSATAEADFLKPVIVPEGPNKYRLTVVLSEQAPPGRVVEIVKVKTSDPDQPEIEIQVSANVTRG